MSSSDTSSWAFGRGFNSPRPTKISLYERNFVAHSLGEGGLSLIFLSSFLFSPFPHKPQRQSRRLTPVTVLLSPQMPLCKCQARSTLQIPLKLLRPLLIFKPHIRYQLPWSISRSVRRTSLIMLREPLLHVVGQPTYGRKGSERLWMRSTYFIAGRGVEVYRYKSAVVADTSDGWGTATPKPVNHIFYRGMELQRTKSPLSWKTLERIALVGKVLALPLGRPAVGVICELSMSRSLALQL